MAHAPQPRAPRWRSRPCLRTLSSAHPGAYKYEGAWKSYYFLLISPDSHVRVGFMKLNLWSCLQKTHLIQNNFNNLWSWWRSCAKKDLKSLYRVPNLLVKLVSCLFDCFISTDSSSLTHFRLELIFVCLPTNDLDDFESSMFYINSVHWALKNI